MAASFNPPTDNASPSQSTGGASRSGLQFTPPSDHSTPRQTSGGASRGETFFIPLPDHTTPRQTYGGASREGAFIPPPDNATPSSTTGGGSRTGEYANTEANEDLLGVPALSMLAMTPSNFYGLTLSERPTFMAYIPASTSTQAIFSLKDEAQTVVYEKVLPLDGKAGIIAVQLPDDAPALNLDQYYQWFVTIQTEEYLTPSSPFVEAWVKRVTPTSDMAQVLESGDAIAMAEALAQAGIWYDTSAILAELQREASLPSNTRVAHWTELLSSVGLENLATVPVVLTPPTPQSPPVPLR